MRSEIILNIYIGFDEMNLKPKIDEFVKSGVGWVKERKPIV